MRAPGPRGLDRDVEAVRGTVRVREDDDYVFEAHGNSPAAGKLRPLYDYTGDAVP